MSLRALVIACALLSMAAPARAQAVVAPQTTATPASAEVEFLPRFDFYVSMEHLRSEEPRYVWDANFGGDVDLVSFGRGRASFVANYQTILGNEYRPFDPNQGNYILEGSASMRVSALEVAGVFHHVSRHLSDRPKRQAVDWNMVGGRVRGGGRHNNLEYDARADLRGVIQHSFVDYRWELDSQASVRAALRPRVSLQAIGGWRVLGTDGTRARGTQYGYRGEGGVRLAGRGALLDLFVASEQRIDAYQLEFGTVRWVTVGFRISSLGQSRVP